MIGPSSDVAVQPSAAAIRLRVNIVIASRPANALATDAVYGWNVPCGRNAPANAASFPWSSACRGEVFRDRAAAALHRPPAAAPDLTVKSSEVSQAVGSPEQATVGPLDDHLFGLGQGQVL